MGLVLWGVDIYTDTGVNHYRVQREFRFEESKEEYQMLQQPFSQPEAQPPKVEPLLPLRYCEFRTSSQEYGDASPEVNICATFASDVVEEMSFCFQHAQIIVAALGNLRESAP